MRCSRHIMGNGSGGVHYDGGNLNFSAHQVVFLIVFAWIYLIHHYIPPFGDYEL